MAAKQRYFIVKQTFTVAADSATEAMTKVTKALAPVKQSYASNSDYLAKLQAEVVCNYTGDESYYGESMYGCCGAGFLYGFDRDMLTQPKGYLETLEDSVHRSRKLLVAIVTTDQWENSEKILTKAGWKRGSDEVFNPNSRNKILIIYKDRNEPGAGDDVDDDF